MRKPSFSPSPNRHHTSRKPQDIIGPALSSLDAGRERTAVLREGPDSYPGVHLHRDSRVAHRFAPTVEPSGLRAAAWQVVRSLFYDELEIQQQVRFPEWASAIAAVARPPTTACSRSNESPFQGDSYEARLMPHYTCCRCRRLPMCRTTLLGIHTRNKAPSLVNLQQ